MRRLSLLAAATAAVTSLVAAPAATTSPRPQLGLVPDGPRSWLVRIDPDTLAVRPGRRLDVGQHGSAWSFSRDGTRLALGGDLDNRAIPTVLVVDTRRLAALGRIRLASRGEARATAWLPNGRLVAVVSVFESVSVHTDVVTVDPARRRVVERRSLGGQPVHVARTLDGLVALLAPTRRVGAARLAIVERSGATRVVAVDLIKAGSGRRSGSGGAEFSNWAPGLAVDPVARRAFVVGAGGEVASVDLVSRTVSYHRLSRQASFSTKSMQGPTRVARWLGRGLVAVSGGDYSVVGKQPRYRPIGLELVDTRTWTVRRLGSGTDMVWPAGRLLLASTGNWSSEVETPRPPGLLVYGADRRQRFRLYDGKRVWVVHADARRAYVSVGGGVELVDLSSGRVIERRKSVPWPLVPPGAPADDS